MPHEHIHATFRTSHDPRSLGRWFKQFQERVVPFTDDEGVERFVMLDHRRAASGMVYRLVVKPAPGETDADMVVLAEAA